MGISKSLSKLFYRCFYIACLFLFVAFPIQSYIPDYGTNDKFWFPFCDFLVYTTLILIVALLLQHLVNHGKRWISFLIPIILFSFTLCSHLPLILEYGARTTQVSDFGFALASSQIQPPLNSTYYAFFPSWAVYVKTLSNVQQLLGTGVLTVLVVNAVLYGLNAILIYCLVLLSNIKNKEFVGFIASAYYAAWPSSYLWCLITSPDYWHIFTLLLALLILGIDVRFAKRGGVKCCLITVAALLIVLSDFYKATAKIMLVAIAIYLILFTINWIQEQATVHKKVYQAKFWQFYKKTGAYVLLFVFVFSFGQKACFQFLDHYVGYTVNRNPTPHYVYVGLFSGSKGSWTPEYAGRFKDLALENNMNYEIATERIMGELKEDIENNKHLNPSMFFTKAKNAFEAENYLYFVRSTLHPDDQVEQADVITRWTSNMNFYYVMIGVLFTWAIYKLRDQDSPLCLIAALYITGFVLTMLLLENQARYKIVIYPYMCILAAYSFAFLPEKIFHKN